MTRYVVLGLLTGVSVAVGLMVVLAGVYWLWLFGDDPWPGWAEVVLIGCAYFAGFAVFVGTVWRGYRTRRRKQDSERR